MTDQQESTVAIIPLHDRIIARRIAAETRIGEIVIPDVAQEKPQQLEVLAVGEGRRDRAGKLQADADGCRGRRSYSRRQVLGQRSRHRRRGAVILREDEVLGVLEEQG